MLGSKGKIAKTKHRSGEKRGKTTIIGEEGKIFFRQQFGLEKEEGRSSNGALLAENFRTFIEGKGSCVVTKKKGREKIRGGTIGEKICVTQRGVFALSTLKKDLPFIRLRRKKKEGGSFTRHASTA